MIEVLVAVAISGMIMAAVASFLFSTAQAYARETYLNAKDEHIQGVASFLRQTFLESQSAEEKLKWSTLPGDENREPEYLSFQLTQPNPLLTYGNINPSGVQCYLKITDPDEFVLLWRPRMMPLEDANEPALFKLIITDQISEISYFYYDSEEERWDKESRPMENDNGLLAMPDYLEFTFKGMTDDDSGKAIRIAVPDPEDHPLIL